MSFIRKMVLPAVAAVLLSFCSGAALTEAGNGESASPDVPRENAVVDVSIVNFDFIPPIISIDPGDIVVWTNDGSVPHTSTSGEPLDPNPGQIWDSGTLMPGDSFTFQFDNPGEYDYLCTVHPLTMFGTVLVGGQGLDVVIVPDDISPGGLSSLDVHVAVFNFTPNTVSGNLWFTVVLPGGGEVLVPPQFMTPPQNPLSGQLGGNDRMDLTVTINVPGGAPSGEYMLVAKIGNYPNQVLKEDGFGFEVP
jgi:plastocyanin